MNTKILKQAREMWNSEYVSLGTNRSNRIKWVRSLRMLGDKWLLAKPMERKHD